MLSPDQFLALIGQHPKPPPIPPHIVPHLVDLGLGKPAINEAWNLCFWTGWWGGFIVGALVMAVVCLIVAGSILSITLLTLWVSNRRINHASMALSRHPDLAPDLRFGPGARPPR